MVTTRFTSIESDTSDEDESGDVQDGLTDATAGERLPGESYRRPQHRQAEDGALHQVLPDLPGQGDRGDTSSNIATNVESLTLTFSLKLSRALPRSLSGVQISYQTFCVNFVILLCALCLQSFVVAFVGKKNQFP